METAGRRRKPQSRLRRAIKMDVTSIPNLLLSAAVCLLCWMMGYTYSAGYPVDARPENLPTWQYLIGLLPDRLTTYVIGASLYALVAGIVQRINYKYIIVRGRRALPALFFFLFVSTNLDTFPLRPVSLSLIGLTLALSQLLGSWQRPDDIGRTFNISVCLSLGALVWPHMVWFIPLFWYGMYRFGSLSARGLLTSVLGLLTAFGKTTTACLKPSITPSQRPMSPFSMLSLSPIGSVRCVSFASLSSPAYTSRCTTRKIQFAHAKTYPSYLSSSAGPLLYYASMLTTRPIFCVYSMSQLLFWSPISSQTSATC